MNVSRYPGKMEKKGKKLVNIVHVMQCSLLVSAQFCCWDKIIDNMTCT